MIFEVSGNVEITGNTRMKIEKMLAGIERTGLTDEKSRALIVLHPYGNSNLTEVTVESKIGLMKAKTVHDDFLTGFELSIRKIEDAIRRQKTRIFETYGLMADRNESNCISTQPTKETLEVGKMNSNEAIVAMDLCNQSFYIYRDVSSEKLILLSKKEDGRIIEYELSEESYRTTQQSKRDH